MSNEIEKEDLPEMEENQESSDILGLSDEELMNLDPSTLESPAVETPAEESEPEEAQAADEPSGEEGDAGAEPVKDDEAPASEEEQQPEVEGAAEPSGSEVNYEAEYKKLFAPFRANGKEMQIKSVDEAITLMQMGANYTKKMVGLAPNLKILKLLENNGLLSEEKLSFLIDLDKKNPEAISKLVKDSGIDPLDMDVSKSEYKPNTYTVDDRELELDAVLEEIQDTPTYSQTISVVSNKWDGPSKQVVAQNPQLLRVINDHMARGIYDRISTEVEHERMLGRLNGVSDIEAYRLVGDAIEARGGFADLAKPAIQPVPTSATPIRVAPKVKAEDPAIRAKKLAASAPKPAAPVKATEMDFNPLSLSDDEFSKLNPSLM